MNGDDVLEYEEGNTERLQKEFCKVRKLSLDRLPESFFDTDNQEYWEFVMQDMVDRGDCEYEMMKGLAVE